MMMITLHIKSDYSKLVWKWLFKKDNIKIINFSVSYKFYYSVRKLIYFKLNLILITTDSNKYLLVILIIKKYLKEKTQKMCL